MKLSKSNVFDCGFPGVASLKIHYNSHLRQSLLFVLMVNLGLRGSIEIDDGFL